MGAEGAGPLILGSASLSAEAEPALLRLAVPDTGALDQSRAA